MFRKTANACTKRNMARFGRASPPSIGNRGHPGTQLCVVDAKSRYINLEQIEDILFVITRKENKS